MVWYTNMAVVTLFWNTNTAAVTTYENALYPGCVENDEDDDVVYCRIYTCGG